MCDGCRPKIFTTKVDELSTVETRNGLLITVPFSLFLSFIIANTLMHDIAAGYAIFALIVASFFGYFERKLQYARKWQIARSVAESMKREGWFFCMGVRPNESQIGTTKDEIVEKLQSLRENLEKQNIVLDSNIF